MSHTLPFSLQRNLLALAIFTLGANSIQAAQSLEKVYVSATRSETADLPVAAQIKIIDAEEIRLSGAKLVSEVLRTQAGIQLTDSDGSGARNVSISMRGLGGANNILVLVDGRKLNNPSLAVPALNTVALKDIERIEVVQGSAGVLYGDQAVGGVINIITHQAAAGETEGGVSVSRGSDNLEDYAAQISQGFANGLSYNLSAQKRNADNFRDNNQAAYDNLFARVRYDFSGGYFFAEGQSVDDELRLPGSLSDALALENPRQSLSPNDYSNQYTDTFRVGGSLALSEHWLLLAEYSDRDEDGHYLYDPTLTQYSMRVKSFTPRVIGEFSLEQGQAVVTLGYDDIDNNYRSDNAWSPVASTQEQQGYYAQLVYPLSQKLTATAGTRYAKVDDENSLSSDHQKDGQQINELGFNYALDEQWQVFGRYAESVRFANPDENNLVLSGVTFLQPQTGNSYELGAQWIGDAAQVSYSLYQMNLDDEIVYDGIRYANVNLPDSEREGLIFDASTVLSENFSLRLNYTYTDAEVSAGFYKGKDVPFVASHSGSASVVFTPVRDFDINIESLYTGSRFKADDESNSSPRLDALVVFNINFVYQIQQVDVAFRINNITDEHYAGYQSVWGQYPQPERNYEASLTYRF